MAPALSSLKELCLLPTKSFFRWGAGLSLFLFWRHFQSKSSQGDGAFHQCPPRLQLLDMKIFVDTDSDIRLVRRLRRDITERGRDIEGVIKQYNKFVKPAFEQYIEPTMRLADIVVPRGKTAAADHFVKSSSLISLKRNYRLHLQLCLFFFQGGGNMVAIDLIVQHVHSQLEEVSHCMLEAGATMCLKVAHRINRDLFFHLLFANSRTRKLNVKVLNIDK